MMSCLHEYTMGVFPKSCVISIPSSFYTDAEYIFIGFCATLLSLLLVTVLPFPCSYWDHLLRLSLSLYFSLFCFILLVVYCVSSCFLSPSTSLHLQLSALPVSHTHTHIRTHTLSLSHTRTHTLSPFLCVSISVGLSLFLSVCLSV